MTLPTLGGTAVETLGGLAVAKDGDPFWVGALVVIGLGSIPLCLAYLRRG